MGRRATAYLKSTQTGSVALRWDAQQPLPGFAPRTRGELPRAERDAYAELVTGPFALCVTELAGYAREAHERYRKRGVPLAWIHPEQLARAIGLVVLRDPVTPVGIVTGSLVRLPLCGSAREQRFVSIHECAEHLLRHERDAEHADVQALTMLLHVERSDVSAAVRLLGRARAHVALARDHRRVPSWILRAGVALWTAEKPM